MNLKEEINRIKKLIESTSDEEKQSPTEQTLIDLLLKNNFIKLTSQKQADEILKIKKKIDLSLGEWAYVKAQEGLICTKDKKTKTIYFSRTTIKVNNRKYWEPYSISENTPEKKLEESTDVAMSTYSFNFPLNSEDLRKYNLAIKYYITNLIPKKELEKMEKSDLKSYIEKIESITPDPKNDYYNNTFKNAVGTAKENLEYLQPNEKSELLGLLNQKINRALNIGYTLT